MSSQPLDEAIHRVADIITTRMTRCAIYDDGAPITAQVLAYAVLPLDPTTAFDWPAWDRAWRATRRDGTRPAVKELHDALRDRLAAALGGEVGLAGGGTRYRPEQIRAAALTAV